MKPFTVSVGDDVLEDLRRRLDATRWPDEAPDAVAEHGFGLHQARTLAGYWRSRLRLAGGRGGAQRLLAMDGADGVHFIAEGDGPPLLLLHGWPSSVWEFHRIVPLLRSDMRRRRAVAAGLRLLVHSGRAALRGRRVRRRAARADGLARPRALPRARAATGARASPSGSAHAYPDAVHALHLYMLPLRRPATWPESELASREALERWLDVEGGYVHIQGTRPRRCAYGLHDSPVGLMSWIAEKFDRWTDARARADRRPADDGDDLLGHRQHRLVVLAVLVAAARRVGARRRRRRRRAAARAPLTFLDFPREIVRVPRVVAERAFEIERWEEPEYGGHFPALEATDVLADSLRRFSRR